MKPLTAETKNQLKWKWGALTLWILPLSLVLSLGLSSHFVSHKKEPLRGIASEDGFRVHHFLSLRCSCSKNLVKHLLTRRVRSNTHEIVHLIHSQEKVAGELRAAGFSVEELEEDLAVEKFNLKALPQLVVTDSSQVLYQGGYAPDQQHSRAYQDERIIADALQAKGLTEFPIFGCANGQLAKKQLDLLGLKYDRD